MKKILNIMLVAVCVLFCACGNADLKNKEEALELAKYLGSVGDVLSHAKLVEELKDSGYTEAEATYAADNCGENWDNNAINVAIIYAKYNRPRHEIISKLTKEDLFTYEQAIRAVDAVVGK